MKIKIAILFTTLLSLPAFSKSIECQAFEIHDTDVLEESFSTGEYPNLEVSIVPGEERLQIGASLYDKSQILSAELVPTGDKGFKVEFAMTDRYDLDKILDFQIATLVLEGPLNEHSQLYLDNKLIASLNCKQSI